MAELWNYALIGLSLIYALMVVATVYTVLHERRDPVRAVSWIAVVVAIPIFGLITFVFFGQNYRKQKIFNRKELKDLKVFEEISKRQIRSLDGIKAEDIASNRDIITLLLNNSKSLLTQDNEVLILNDGAATFRTMIADLQTAERVIHMEYYIFENDTLGSQIAEILMERAAAGVEVRFIYDDVGSWHLSRRFIARLRAAGVQVHCFMPVVFPWLTSKVNYRNHRKIVVIDGLIGYTGGLNVADRYIHGTKHGVWRDTHLRIIGSAVQMLQVTFMTDWYFAAGERLTDYSRYLPQSRPPAALHRSDISTLIDNRDKCALQIVVSGPDSDYEAIMQAYFAAIAKASHHIYISTPYFLPNQVILTAIKVAAMRGIDVKILLPLRSDSKIVHWASRSYFTELLQAGIKIYLYTKGFNHSKLIMVDSHFSSVGTANMDMRSFEDNFEISAMIYDREKTEELELQFLKDIVSARRLTLYRWQKRKHQDNFKESVARLFSPLL